MTTSLQKKAHTFIGEEEKEVSLSPAIFDISVDTQALSEIVVLMQKNKRAPTAHAKGRSEVRGGGRKPWRQKGTGRARHGSIRSPIWKGGGVTHGPTKERDYSVKINRKARAKALKMVLSGKLRDDEIILVDSLSLKSHKTQELVKKVHSLFNKKENNEKKILLVPKKANTQLKRASSNIPNVQVKEARQISALDLLSVKYVVMGVSAVKDLEKRLS